MDMCRNSTVSTQVHFLCKKCFLCKKAMNYNWIKGESPRIQYVLLRSTNMLPNNKKLCLRLQWTNGLVNDLVCLNYAIKCIIWYISVKKLMITDKYWSIYGPTRFDTATVSFRAKPCWALIYSILDHCHHIMNINVVDDIMYHCARQGSD